MGFEPTTFCMASSAWVSTSPRDFPANRHDLRSEGRAPLPCFHREITGVWVPNGYRAAEILAARSLGGDVAVWPRTGAFAFVQGVGCKVCAAGPDDRAGLGEEAGFTRFRRTAETPFNLVLELRP